MSGADESRFRYVTYIRASAEQLWDGLTNPEFMAQYWFGMHAESIWEVGADWRLVFADGRLADTGEVLEAAPPHRLVLKWRNEFRHELKEEGFSRCVFEIEEMPGAVKLTVTHTIPVVESKFIAGVANGWPRIISNLKSLLETGDVVVG